MNQQESIQRMEFGLKSLIASEVAQRAYRFAYINAGEKLHAMKPVEEEMDTLIDTDTIINNAYTKEATQQSELDNSVDMGGVDVSRYRLAETVSIAASLEDYLKNLHPEITLPTNDFIDMSILQNMVTHLLEVQKHIDAQIQASPDGKIEPRNSYELRTQAMEAAEATESESYDFF